MLTIKEIPKEERPREKLLKYGSNNLSNSELLSIVLKTGTKGSNVTELANNLLNKLNHFVDLKDINKERLISIKGIGEAKAIELLATIELGKRLFITPDYNAKTIYNNSKIIYSDNKHLFIGKKQEYFYCIYLNTKKEVIERKLLFMGTVNQSLVHPREIFKEAYLLSSASIICMHNHPSGDPKPSIDDIMLTNSLIEIGKLQQIPVIDHIIFGNNQYYSFYEESKNMR